MSLVTWSEEQVELGLPNIMVTTDPSNPIDEQYSDEWWSMVCRFEKPPVEQGNPSRAYVRFLLKKAPHKLLQTGAKFQLFERATQKFAVIEIL